MVAPVDVLDKVLVVDLALLIRRHAASIMKQGLVNRDATITDDQLIFSVKMLSCTTTKNALHRRYFQRLHSTGVQPPRCSSERVTIIEGLRDSHHQALALPVTSFVNSLHAWICTCDCLVGLDREF